ncbi:MAG: HTH-type transcriptional repressor FabR [Proteobacteria bacterium]|nr:HTH-type transcriptional repressor FabR [Pseudomonadota bacterium]
MGTRAEKKAKTRKNIIGAALSLSTQNGFACLSLREVTRSAGIAPTSFYRHFKDMEDLGLALVDEVSLTLRQLLRQARRRARVRRGVIRTSVETFMEYLEHNEQHFRLLIGERLGEQKGFRKEIKKETRRFVEELAEDIQKESEASRREIINPDLVAETMITVVFNIGMEALEFPPKQRIEFAERMVQQLEMILLGAEALSKGWKASAGQRLSRALVVDFTELSGDDELHLSPM